MQHAGSQESGPNLEMSLREHLLAAGASEQQQHGPYPPPAQQNSGGSGPENPYQGSNSGSPHEHHLDPSIGGHTMPYAIAPQHSDGDSMQSTPKGKRELSTSKRAAQNRAAQRAFRQRKEGYIKKLEEQVKDYEQIELNYRTLQAENFQLREYILNLQSRLLETQGDVPAAPPNIHLSGGAPPPPGGMGNDRMDADGNDARHDGVARLQAAAAQAEAKAQDDSNFAARQQGENKAPAGEDGNAS